MKTREFIIVGLLCSLGLLAVCAEWRLRTIDEARRHADYEWGYLEERYNECLARCGP